MSDIDKIATYLSAFLAPAIALVTSYIAVQQYRLNKLKVRHDLYEPRMRIYRTIMEFLSYIMQNGSTTDEELTRLLRDTSEARFLFRGKVKKHIEFLYQRALDLQEINRELSEPGLPVGDRRSELAKSKSALFKWFRGQIGVTRDIFTRYLKMGT